MISKSLPLLVVVAVVGIIGLFGLSNPLAAQQNLMRSFSDTEVAPGGTLTVTISGLDLADAPELRSFGQVTETLPPSFSYVPGSAAVDVGGDKAEVSAVPSGQDIEFTVIRIDSFTYQVSVDANAAAGAAHFDGENDVGELIGGQDQVTVVVQTTTPDPPEPTTEVTRALPASAVSPGGEFTVTISGLGLADAPELRSFGSVEENLPAGFSYVDGSAAVESGGDGQTISAVESGQMVDFTFIRVDSFSYRVSVDSGVSGGAYPFSGTAELDETTTIGGDGSVTVAASEPPPTGDGVTRSFSPDPVDAGAEVTVTISGLGLADAPELRSFGSVEENLPAGFSYVDGSAAVESGGDGQTISAVESGQMVDFTFIRVDSFSYRVAVGEDVADGLYPFSGSAELDEVTTIGGDTSLRVGPEPVTPEPVTPEPVTPEPVTPGPTDPTTPTHTPRPTRVPSAPSTPVAIEIVSDVTAAEGATVVQPDTSSMVSSADGMATVMLPNTSRARTYQVMVSSDMAGCSGLEGSLQACASVTSYDAEGNMETGVMLIRRATVVLMLGADAVEELGGLPTAFQANALGGFSVYQQGADGSWGMRRFTMGLAEDGGLTVTVTGLRTLGSLALTVDEDILQTAMYQVAGITPTPVQPSTPLPAPATVTPAPTAVPPTPEPTAVPPEKEPEVGDTTLPVGLLVVLTLTGALMVYTGSRFMRRKPVATRR